MFKKAKDFLEEHIYEAKDMEEMKKLAKEKIGFIKANWCGEKDCEAEIKAETEGFGSRCIDESAKVEGKCVHCEKDAKYKVFWGKSY